jgi:hypothetical protein
VLFADKQAIGHRKRPARHWSHALWKFQEEDFSADGCRNIPITLLDRGSER